MKPHGPLAVGNTGHCVTTQHSMNHTHGMLLCSEALLCALSARHTAQLLCTRHPAIRGEPAASTVCVLFLAVLHSRAWRAVGYLTNLVVGRLCSSWPAKLTSARALTNQPFLHTCSCRQNAFSKTSGSQSIVPQCSAVQHESNQHGCASQDLNCTHT